MDQLSEIVEKAATYKPTFAEWLEAGGYGDVARDLSNAAGMSAGVQALYLRYLREQGRAA